MSLDLGIVDGRVVLPGGLEQPLNIGVRDGRVVTLTSAPIEADTIVDAAGLTVLPGMIDEHFHVFRGYPWETHRQATRAAAKGGITTVVDMPIDKPAILAPDLVDEKREALADECYVDYALFGGYPSGAPEQMTAMVDGGVSAFKLFTGELSPPGMYPGVSDGEMLDAMRRAAELGVTVVVHCENESIVEFETKRLHDEGRQDREVWDEVRPWFSELDASQRVLLLAEVTGCRTVLAHATSPRVAEAAAAARARGAQVWVETTPHNLLISMETMAQDPRLKWNPPSRPQRDLDELWRRLADGEVHTVGSDHAPLAKIDGADIWTQVPGAGNAVETMFPITATECLARGMSLHKVVELLSSAPAQAFGLYPRKGVIAVGSDADFVIVKTGADARVDAARLEYDGQEPWSPFDGRALSVVPVHTLVRGRLVVSDGDVVGAPGHGELVTSTSGAAATPAAVSSTKS